eukprot:g1276.t1
MWGTAFPALVILFAGSVLSWAAQSSDEAWLQAQTERIINESRVVAWNGVALFSPDASGHYTAQYTRDFYYGLAWTPVSLWGREEAVRAVNYTFQRQREDGCMPDKVTSDNRTGYAPGPVDFPMADHAWDNGPFAALLLTEVSQKWGLAKDLFCDLEPRARGALDFLNLSSSSGLVFNDPQKPNCTYGFTDNIAKTGELLFTSLLLYDAATKLAELARECSCGDSAWYAARADAVARSLDQSLYDEASGLWVAATIDNRYPDVWGSLYVVALGLSTEERRMRALTSLFPPGKNTETLRCSCCDGKPAYQSGQMRHLPSGCYWNRCIFDTPAHPRCSQLPRGTYQNGAFWATPLHYAADAALESGDNATIQRVKDIVSEAVAFFRNGKEGFLAAPAINEAINAAIPYSGAVDYLASAASALSAASKLWQA